MSRRRPDVLVLTRHSWRDGAFLSASDEEVLSAAYADGLTLVTCDTQILSDLRYRFDQGIPFAGLVFVDDSSIAGNEAPD